MVVDRGDRGRRWMKWVKVVKTLKKQVGHSLSKVRTQVARCPVLGPVVPTPPKCVSPQKAALRCDPFTLAH